MIQSLFRRNRYRRAALNRVNPSTALMELDLLANEALHTAQQIRDNVALLRAQDTAASAEAASIAADRETTANRETREDGGRDE